MVGSAKTLIKKIINSIGLDVLRLKNHPKNTLLGLRGLPIRSIIDVGANKGQFACNIVKIFPEAHIYCFEPLPKPFGELKKWAVIQQGKTTLFNLALGEKEGNVDIFEHLEHSPSSSFLQSTGVCEELYPFTKKRVSVPVKMVTLDKVLSNLPPLICDVLIKLDVQGYEDRVISGGAEAFQNAKACILEISLDLLYEKQASFKNIIDLLDGHGFRYMGNLEQTYAEDGHVIYFDAVFVK